MVQICQGMKTKAEVLAENVELYKDMYIRTKRDFARIVQVWRCLFFMVCVTEQYECQHRTSAIVSVEILPVMKPTS